MKRSDATQKTASNPGPMTLEELGVPKPLAREMETALRALGGVPGGSQRWRVFVTPDGAKHPLRMAEPAEERRRAANG